MYYECVTLMLNFVFTLPRIEPRRAPLQFYRRGLMKRVPWYNVRPPDSQMWLRNHLQRGILEEGLFRLD